MELKPGYPNIPDKLGKLGKLGKQGKVGRSLTFGKVAILSQPG